jgi:YlmC/YmxH family sporulation protein
MREITTTDLCAMEVINLCDGGRLGYPSALELCAEDGKITALIIPRDCGFLGFGKSERYRIPWCRIECIGEDAILVKLTAAELTNCLVGGKGKRK